MHEGILLRIIDAPFEIIAASYTKHNKLFLEADDGDYCFDDSGILIKIPEDDSQLEEDWETMLCVDDYEELDFFPSDQRKGRQVGVNMLIGLQQLKKNKYEVTIELDRSIGSKKIEGILRANTETNDEDFRDNPETLPLAIITEDDMLLHPANIFLKNIFPAKGNVGSGGVAFGGHRCIAVFKL